MNAKAQNDDWSGTASTWGDGFEVELVAEGNEAAGEGILTVTDMTVCKHIVENTDLRPGDRSNAYDHTTSKTWESTDVRLTARMHGDAETVDEYAEETFEVAEQTLSDGFKEVDE